MIELTDEMKSAFESAIDDGAPVLVASASNAGMPDIAFKGSAMVFDKDHIAFWERALGTTYANLKENPGCCLLYRNAATRQAWKFFGEATVHNEGDIRQQVMDRTIQLELDKDPDRRGAAILVRIDRVLQAGKVLMERE